MDAKRRCFAVGGSSRQLAVILHASGLTPDSMRDVTELIRSALPDTDTWAPRLPIGNMLSRSRGADMTRDLLHGVDELVAERAARTADTGYETILFVGHSYGAALARAVWAEAMGGQPDGSVDLRQARPWAARVSRIVLLAAVARGWNQLAPVSTKIRLATWGAGLIETVLGPDFAMLDIRRGAPWITATRLKILSAFEALRQAGLAPPLTVQLLGTVDDIVAPADNVDLATGAGFYYVEVPRTNHLNVVQFDGRVGAKRRDLIRIALLGSPAELEAIAVPRSVLAEMVDDTLDDFDNVGQPSSRRDVKTVIFIVHGIRDYGYWTRKLGVRIKARAAACRTVTSSYGFFPMGPFLLKPERRKRAGWLMDQYVTAKALYPQAESCHFVGHSNGTYLLAAALQSCRAIRFDNVVFAGSVVRPDYPWQKLMHPAAGQPQVKRVVNYVATRDLVVASIPNALQVLKSADLGCAGHKGFAEQPNVRNVEWVPGGHGAAVKDEHWDEIANFVLSGDFPPDRLAAAPDAEAPLRATRQGRVAAAIGAIAPAGVPALAVGGTFFLWKGLEHVAAYSVTAFSLALLALFWFGSRVLTRV